MSSTIRQLVVIPVMIATQIAFAQPSSGVIMNKSLTVSLCFDSSHGIIKSDDAYQPVNSNCNRQPSFVSNGPSPTMVRHYYSHMRSSGDAFTSVVTDHEGKIYASGSTEGGIPARPLSLLTKYSSDGSREWLVLDSTDVGITHLTVDSTDCIIVQGDAFLEKYSASGHPLWRLNTVSQWHPYVDPQNNFYLNYADDNGRPGPLTKYDVDGKELWSVDSAGFVVPDAQGNVFVARPAGQDAHWWNVYSGRPSGSGSEIVVAKYDPSGTSEWENRYSLGVRMNVSSIDLSDSGLTVVGETMDASFNWRLIVMRYALDGGRQWTWVWSDTPAYFPGWVTDKVGNIYLFGMDFHSGGGSLMKLGKQGKVEWTTSEVGYVGREITFDRAGHIIVTWLAGYGGDWSAAAFDSTGKALWKTTSALIAGNANAPTGLIACADGRSLVMGSLSDVAPFYVMSCSNMGDLQWDLRYSSSPQGVAVDGEGNLFLIGDLQKNHPGDAVLRNISPDGKTAWVATYAGPMEPDEHAGGTGMDDNGDLYVLCHSGYSSGKPAFDVVKFDPDGNALWSKRDSISGNSEIAVAADGSTRLMKFEYTDDSNSVGTGTITLDKLTNSGDRAWSVASRMPPGVYVSTLPLVVDASGSTFIVARQGRSGEPDAIVIRKYLQDGALSWALECPDSLAASELQVNSLALGRQGNLYVAYVDRISDSYYCHIMKTSPNGQLLWKRTFGSSPWSSIFTVGSDEKEEVCTAGVILSDVNNPELVIARFDSAGNPLSLTRDRTFGFPYYASLQLGLDKKGNVFLAGNVYDSTVCYCVTASLDSRGNSRWIDRVPLLTSPILGGGNAGPTTAMLFPSGPSVSVHLSMLPNGDLYVSCNDSGFVTTKYTNAGARLWSYRYTLPGWPVYYDAPSTHYDNQGRLFVVGGTGGMVTILRYDEGFTSTQPPVSDIPTTCALSQNYPNPFNPTTTIRYELPKASIVKLSVYDILGREVSVLVNEKKDPGSYEVKFDGNGLPSGVYFYEFRAGAFTRTKKLLLVR
jgi:hypothetical protein